MSRVLPALSRAVAAVALTGAAVLVPAALSAPAGAAPAATCTAPQVAVVVDFSHFGGPVQRACSDWSSSLTGFSLLNNHGFITQGTRHDGPGFICRISLNGSSTYYPTPAQDRCNVTPPATAYWSYWHAQQGDSSWEYSQYGAMAYQPKQGSVDVWTFGGTDLKGSYGQPGFSPASVLPARRVAVPVQPAPSTTRQGAQGPGQGGSGQGSSGQGGSGQSGQRSSTGRTPSTTGPRTSASTTVSGRARPTTSAHRPTTSGPSGGLAGGPASSGGARIENVNGTPPAAKPAAVGGSTAPAFIGIGVVALLAAAAGFVVWRRRQTG